MVTGMTAMDGSMTEALYREVPGVRWSHLKAMAVSPLHYRSAVTRERDVETNAMRVGRALHCAVLEPDAFHKTWVTFPGRRAGKTWDAFLEKASSAGQEILSNAEYVRVVNSGAAVRRHERAMRYLGGACERATSWMDSETGVLCKARCDLVSDWLVDLKSTAQLDERRFGTTAAQLGYHAQLAFYWDGLMRNRWVVDFEPRIVAVEQFPPHDVVVYTVPVAIIDLGRRLYRRLLGRVAECETLSSWPGRAPTEEVELVLPEWAYGDPSMSDGGLIFDGVPTEDE